MEEYNDPADVLLDSLDGSVNSNTALLHFNIHNSANFNLERFLLNQLRTGYFHSALVQSDIRRGWEHYVQAELSKNWNETMIVLQNPGNSWNGNEQLGITEITESQAREYLADLMTGGEKFFSRSGLGTRLDKDAAARVLDHFMPHIKGAQGSKVTFYHIAPDFLYTVDDYYGSDMTLPGYFEKSGRDFVLGIHLYKEETDQMELYILMTNGYS